jgi:uncharacterized protein (TIGR03435 family)
MAVIPKGRCIFRNATLIGIIAEAYDVPPRRVDELISGGPGWIRTDRYNVEAKAEDDFATTSELRSAGGGLVVGLNQHELSGMCRT